MLKRKKELSESEKIDQEISEFKQKKIPILKKEIQDLKSKSLSPLESTQKSKLEEYINANKRFDTLQQEYLELDRNYKEIQNLLQSSNDTTPPLFSNDISEQEANLHIKIDHQQKLNLQLSDEISKLNQKAYHLQHLLFNSLKGQQFQSQQNIHFQSEVNYQQNQIYDGPNNAPLINPW